MAVGSHTLSFNVTAGAGAGAANGPNPITAVQFTLNTDNQQDAILAVLQNLKRAVNRGTCNSTSVTFT